MNKQITSFIVIFIIAAVGIFLYFNTDLLKSNMAISTPETGRDLSSLVPSLTPPNIEVLPSKDTEVKRQAWAVWEKYIKVAKAHNLAQLRTLAHQISDTCNDPNKEKECFDLMDSVVNFSTLLTQDIFTHVQYDDRQIMLYTDGPGVATLYFTKDINGSIKVLGLRFCQEVETSDTRCVETDPAKRDKNNNGWWDQVESLFYK